MLGTRALNRALLARQHLLARAEGPVLDLLEHLVGLQAQEPQEPYVGVWSRLRDVAPADLSGLLARREAVRVLLMRRTLHLVSARDCLRLRRLHDPMLVARMRGTFGRRLPGVDEAELAAAGRTPVRRCAEHVDGGRPGVGHRWPQAAARDLGDALSTLLPLVQVPPRGLWRQSAPASSTTIDVWLGAEPEDATTETAEALVLRYLAAYGPAATADIRAWSGLTGLPAVVARLRPQLRTFRDERGRALLDVPGAPLPTLTLPRRPGSCPRSTTPCSRFDDRRRIVDDADRGLSVLGARFLLVDGRVAGTWTTAQDGGALHIDVTVHRRLTAEARDDVVQEGARLAAFLADGDPGAGCGWPSAERTALRRAHCGGTRGRSPTSPGYGSPGRRAAPTVVSDTGDRARAPRGRERPRGDRARRAEPPDQRRRRLRHLGLPAARAGRDPRRAGRPQAHRRVPPGQVDLVRDLGLGRSHTPVRSSASTSA